VRRESNGFVQLLASHVRSTGIAAESALQRAAALERAAAAQAAQQRSPPPSGLHVLR
jgi:hypothetical protein